MNRYKTLISNTAIFAIGTFSSKALVFLLMPLYTRVLSDADYGLVDLLIQTGNLLLPLVSVGIVNAIVRFGLDSDYAKEDVFSAGLYTILAGFGVLVLLSPLLAGLPLFGEHTWLILLFVLMSSLRSLCSQFTRARGMVRLYAIDGLVSTAATILFNLLYLLGLRWGILGYMLAIVSADCLSVVFLTGTGRLWRFLKWKGLPSRTVKSMLRYSIPLIPATMFWWVTNVSDRYMVSYMLGSAANGLYAVSYKIPTVVVLASSIFMDAWQMSALGERQGLERERFFSQVFGSYQALLFTAGSGLVLLARPITRLLVSAAFYPSWQYIPLLVMATVYSCMGTFMGSVYMTEKSSMSALLTSAAGAVLNILLNLWLIPQMGVNGAALATLVSYMVVFGLRAADTRRLLTVRFRPLDLCTNTAVLGAQAWILLTQPPHWVVLETVFFALMVAKNAPLLLGSVKKLLRTP